MLPRAVAFLLMLLCCLGCRSREQMYVVADNPIILDSLPSASGMALWKDSAWVVGDDATSIYRLAKSGYYRSVSINKYADAPYRIPKPVKPDFEAALMGDIEGKEYLFAFGSGSLSPQRDSLLLLDVSGSQQPALLSLSKFYEVLRREGKLSQTELNLEGAALNKGDLFLFNRGKDIIFRVDWLEFVSMISGASIPDITVFTVVLPERDGLKAGFSGACSYIDGQILFSASLEAAHDAISDGKIYGSYIGLLALNETKPQIKNIALLKDKQNRVVVDKIETLEMIHKHDDTTFILAMTDNDDGSSKLANIRLFFERK